MSREVARHGGPSAYRATEADARTWEWARRPKPCHLARYPELRWCVAEKLALDWSPEQISGWLKREFPADQGLQVSPETLYRSLFVQARGVLKKELMDHLRAGRRMRHPKGGTTPSRLPGQIVDAVSIRERPAEVEDRAVPGHWEGDLLSGANNSLMATLVERHSRFAMLIKVQGKDTASVVSALSKQVRQLPLELRRSLVELRRWALGPSSAMSGSSRRSALEHRPVDRDRRAEPQRARGVARFAINAILMESAFVSASCHLVAIVLHTNFEVHRRARGWRGLGLEHVVGRFQFQIELVEHTGHRQCHLHFGQALAQAGVRAAAVR